jgi:antitoxin component YwqK of YwqJK toxin-antitoxin module
MKIQGFIIPAILLLAMGNIHAQMLPADSIPPFLADSLKAVYIYADTGKALNRIDAQGMKQGLWEKRYDDGNLRYRGHFWDGKPDGVFKHYYDGDSLEGIYIYSDNGKVAHAHIFYTTGALWAEGKFVNQKEDSIWKYYDEAQHLKRKDSYKDGKENGKQVIFYPSGNPLQVKNWVNDLAEGPFEQYYDEGGVKEEGTFEHGLLQDTLYVYDPDGKLAIKGRYFNDLHEGAWIYYSSGEPKDTLVYHKGKCINCEKYSMTKKQEDSLRIHYQGLQEKLDHPGSLEDEYQQPGGGE